MATAPIATFTNRVQRHEAIGGEDPSEQQAEGAAAAGNGAVDAEGPPAFARVGERRGQHGQGGRSQKGAEGALEHPGDQQHGEAGGEATEGRGGGEPGQTDHEGPLAAEDVGEATAEEQQAAERQGVAGHDPLAVGIGESERVLGRRQGDIHDGGVQHHHDLGQAQHGQDQPPPVVVGVLRRRCGSFCWPRHQLTRHGPSSLWVNLSGVVRNPRCAQRGEARFDSPN